MWSAFFSVIGCRRYPFCGDTSGSIWVPDLSVLAMMYDFGVSGCLDLLSCHRNHDRRFLSSSGLLFCPAFSLLNLCQADKSTFFLLGVPAILFLSSASFRILPAVPWVDRTSGYGLLSNCWLDNFPLGFCWGQVSSFLPQWWPYLFLISSFSKLDHILNRCGKYWKRNHLSVLLDCYISTPPYVKKQRPPRNPRNNKSFITKRKTL